MIDWADVGISEDEANSKLSRAKTNLFFKKNAAFLASIMGQTAFVWSLHNNTAWTDGRQIGINPYFFFKKIKSGGRITVIAHELWHIAYDYWARMMGRDPDLWNQAQDHVINLMLKEQQFDFEGLEFALADEKYKGWASEEVYEDLKKNPPPPMGGGGGDLPLTGDVMPMPEGMTHQEIMSKVIAAVQANARSTVPGSIPGEIQLAIENFLNPVVPWEVVLRRFFTEQSKQDYSYRRPNRRHSDWILPSILSDDGLTDINYYLDISGSVSDEDILRFNSEVAAIKREYNPETLTLVTFDTQIQDVYTFTEDEPFEKIIVTGRGGTDLKPVREHILRTRPSVCVIFSDLWVDPMEPVDGIPVVWIVVGSPDATVPFGTMVHIPNETAHVLLTPQQMAQGGYYYNPETGEKI